MDKLPDWKQHPVIVAIIAGAAVAVFMLQFIVPIFVKEREVEIADLKKQIVSLPGAIENASKLEKENKELKLRIRELSTDNLFSAEDVRPKGYRQVRIGDPIARLREAYPAASIKEEERWVTVTISDSLFRQANYLFDPDLKPGPAVVRMIIFFFNERQGETAELIRRQLAEKYGGANLKENRKQQWEMTVLGYDLELDPKSSAYSLKLHSK